MMRYLILVSLLFILGGCGQNVDDSLPNQRGNFQQQADDPATTNDESNDQPVGYFGSLTLHATNHGSGNSYPLDADMDGRYVERVYFERGGWVWFPDCELDNDLYGECYDHDGRGWTFDGEY